MKLANLSIVTAVACLITTSLHALETEDRILKGNYQIEYTKTPGDVNSLGEMLSEGEFYGRVRSNMFKWDWDNENKSVQDNDMWGLGGSLIYKTGFFYGFGATVGFYGTQQVLDENTNPDYPNTNFGRAGKDTYHTRSDGSEGGIGVLAEEYLEYKAGKTDVKVGRQIIDSILLASNDSKMVPNTFEGTVVENKDIKDTLVRAGYIMSQKLRDHQSFHSIIAFEKYNENDGASAHKGLSVKNIDKAGEDVHPEMILVTASNKSISNLKLDAEYVGLDGYFSTIIAEANYQIKLNDSWTLTPGIRYLRQMDDGAGAIGGAALSGKAATTANGGSAAARASYTNPSSVDGSIIMARLVAANGPLELSAGYSKIADDADIIAPWRGFPTGGYTRSMAQVDWIANTKNWAVKAVYDFGKAGVVPGLLVAADYENMNFDDAKAATTRLTDRDIFHVDATQTFKAIPNTEFKLRFATVDADPAVGATTDYNSYNEYRFEINYLF